MYERRGKRWRRFKDGFGTVHLQWLYGKRWTFFCSEQARFRGVVVPDSERITCQHCGRQYTE